MRLSMARLIVTRSRRRRQNARLSDQHQQAADARSQQPTNANTTRGRDRRAKWVAWESLARSDHCVEIYLLFIHYHIHILAVTDCYKRPFIPSSCAYFLWRFYHPGLASTPCPLNTAMTSKTTSYPTLSLLTPVARTKVTLMTPRLLIYQVLNPH